MADQPAGRPYKVTVSTEDGEVLEQFVTAPIVHTGHRSNLIHNVLRDAQALNHIGANAWGEDD